MYVCMYVCIVMLCYVMYVRTYVCMYVRMYVRMYVCMYVCMYVLRGVQLLNLEDGPFFGLEIRAVGRRRCPFVGQYMLLKHSSPIFIYYIDTPDCHV